MALAPAPDGAPVACFGGTGHLEAAPAVAALRQDAVLLEWSTAETSCCHAS